MTMPMPLLMPLSAGALLMPPPMPLALPPMPMPLRRSQAYRWIDDSRDDFTKERLEALDDAYKLFR